MKRLIYILILFTFPVEVLFAQESDTTEIGYGYIQDGDSIIHKNLKEVVVFSKELTKRQERRYSRYVDKVKKVYPLALEARELLKEYEPRYYAIEDPRARRKLMKQLEKELLDNHKDELKKWSISDGRILLKLINRETERTPYTLIKNFRGDFSAIFWQGIARIFSNNLKDGYDPEGDDKMLEEIVTLIEMGYL